MPWRRITSYSYGATPPPRFTNWCSPACCAVNIWNRTRLITTSGYAQNCGLNIFNFDSAQGNKFYQTITGTWTVTWRKAVPGPDPVVRTCNQQVVWTADKTVGGFGESCPSDSTGPDDCDAPSPDCDSPATCYTETTATTWVGTSEITEADLRAYAASHESVTTGPWSDWAIGLPLLSAGSVNDSGGVASVSYTKKEFQIELRGLVPSLRLQWRDTLTSGGVSTTEERILDLPGPGLYSVLFEPAPNQNRSQGQAMILQEY